MARFLTVSCALAACPTLMDAVSITINHPVDGSGATWDCTTVDGETTDCANGSAVSSGLYKWNGTDWVQPNGLGPCRLTATDSNSDWSTSPDYTLGVQSVFTSPGDYRVKATVYDNDTMVSNFDINYWTIP